ncbi:hypothetical protein WJX81_003053 [Elliptochloris bilobata]|uniref:RING-CH-type domain-containing protein n=1 Tax=Elliptochloris bilobata TaxID=381761 RepID=A0AAW1QIN2_9CHLO
MSAQEPSQSGSGAGSAEHPLSRRDRWLPGYFARVGQASRAPRFWRALSWRSPSGSAPNSSGDVETGERLLSRERSTSDDSAAQVLEVRPGSSNALASRPALPANSVEAAPSSEIHVARGAAAEADAPQQLVCLICLDALEPEDFESGGAIVLECACRGELALRHRTCAEKWARVKGDSVCDVCKAPIRNLPAFTPRAPASEGGTEGDAFDLDDRAHNAGPLFLGEQMPGSADIVFDCIRITWIATIVAVLFLNLNLPTALVAGLIVGVGYTLFARAMYRQQIAALQREYLREHPTANPDPTATLNAVVVEPRGGSPTAVAGTPVNPTNSTAGPVGAAAEPVPGQGGHPVAVVV